MLFHKHLCYCIHNPSPHPTTHTHTLFSRRFHPNRPTCIQPEISTIMKVHTIHQTSRLLEALHFTEQEMRMIYWFIFSLSQDALRWVFSLWLKVCRVYPVCFQWGARSSARTHAHTHTHTHTQWPDIKMFITIYSGPISRSAEDVLIIIDSL